MIRPWQHLEAERAAHRLHRWASTLTGVMTVVIILSGIGGVIIVAAGIASNNNAAIYIGFGSFIGAVVSVLPIMVFSAWAQAYASDLRVRVMPPPEIEDDDPAERAAPRRRPRTGRL